MSGDLPSALAAALFAVDPVGLGGVVLRSGATVARDRWLACLRALLPHETPWRRVPVHVDEDRLLGGLDLAATLQAGRPVAQRGLLAEADGGIVLLAMAERVSRSTAASVAGALDTQQLVAERQGIGVRAASRLGVVALDEGLAEDEQVAARLRERLAFHLTLAAAPSRADDAGRHHSGPSGTAASRTEDSGDDLFTRGDVAAARALYADVRIDEALVESLCAAALALGVDSVRAPMFACRAARAAAALDGRREVNADDVALAAGMVLAPRATRVPVSEASPQDAQAAADAEPEDEPQSALQDAPPASESQNPDDDESEPAPSRPETQTGDSDWTTPERTAKSTPGAVDDLVLQAALAALPPGLLASLALRQPKTRGAAAGRAGAEQSGRSRGRPTGVRRGEPQNGARLNLIETLRAAAPWQMQRRREAEAEGRASAARVQVRREDFHVWRFKQRSETTTLFVVDASGSAALHRLAETKGAVELLLADCYVRRDSVAVIAFRGAGAELLLPPTRSLVRAKRSLAGLPGGGGTPLAAGIASAHTLAEAVRRRGATPVVVLMTDGRANIARDGAPGRARATEDALAAARSLGADGFSVLLLDTSPQPQEPARVLAAAMGARYLPLPHAGAATLSHAVRASGVAAAR